MIISFTPHFFTYFCRPCACAKSTMFLLSFSRLFLADVATSNSTSQANISCPLGWMKDLPLDEMNLKKICPNVFEFCPGAIVIGKLLSIFTYQKMLLSICGFTWNCALK